MEKTDIGWNCLSKRPPVTLHFKWSSNRQGLYKLLVWLTYRSRWHGRIFVAILSFGYSLTGYLYRIEFLADTDRNPLIKWNGLLLTRPHSLKNIKICDDSQCIAVNKIRIDNTNPRPEFCGKFMHIFILKTATVENLKRALRRFSLTVTLRWFVCCKYQISIIMCPRYGVFRTGVNSRSQ